jgi:hypothetical protein
VRDADRAVTTIDGLPALRIEGHADGRGLWPSGTPITQYLVDLSPGLDDGPGTLFLDTVGTPPFDYEHNQVVLDRMARSLDITREGTATDPDVVASYQGGGGGFTAVGEVEGAEACLRIPPHGEPACAPTPTDRELETVDLVDLQPVLAGVTGPEVFRVTAELTDGDSTAYLPAPIGDGPTRGFASSGPPDRVERLRWWSITGTELGSRSLDG